MPIGLTDDEVVAVTVNVSRTWHAFLPTVDTTDSTWLLAAATRGRRSLTVRRFYEESESFLRGVEQAAGRSPSVLMYPADPADLAVPRGAVVSMFDLGADQWLLDACAVDGSHAIDLRDRPSVNKFVGTAAKAVWRRGFSSEAPADAVLVVLIDRGDEPRRAVELAQGRVRSGTAEVREDGTTFELGETVAELDGGLLAL